MKQVPTDYPKNIRLHRTKFICYGDFAIGICAHSYIIMSKSLQNTEQCTVSSSFTLFTSFVVVRTITFISITVANSKNRYKLGVQSIIPFQ
jgi:hypothetical protein